MTTTEHPQAFSQDPYFRQRHRSNRIAAGVVIILIGLAVLAKKTGLVFMNIHLWPFILIAIGLYLGAKHKFRHAAAWILIAIGTVHLIPPFELMGVASRHLIFPAALIGGGLFMIFRPKSHFRHRSRYYSNTGIVGDDQLDINVSFGERKAIVTSRNFRGANIYNSFGSTTLNLLQADSSEVMTIDLQVSFGSVEIIVPSHWEVQFELSPTFGSVEDRRYIHTNPGTEKKLIILRGSCSFGSIEVKSA
jgi:predicted membrane protein